MPELREGAKGPGGFVLPVVLLVLLALTLLLHGNLALLRIQERAGRAAGLRLRARLLGEGAVRRAAATLAGPVPAAVRGPGVVLDVRSGPGETVSTRLRRLGREWALLEADAVAGAGEMTARARAGRPVWILDGPARLGGARAAVEAPAPPSGGGAVDGARIGADPVDWPAEACAPHRSVVDSIFAGGGVPAWALLEPGPASGSGVEGPEIPGLGLLSGEQLLRRAELRPKGRVEPEPVLRFGACDARAPLNWGVPSDPLGPCGDLHRLVGAGESLRVVGGEGQGVLVVAGDLTLRGHRFAGVVLVGGRLRLAEGARIDGLVRSAAAVHVAAGSSIRASGCPVLRSLAGLGEVSRPVLLPGIPWLRPL